MDTENTQSWWESRTNITAMVVAVGVLGPIWGNKMFPTLSQEQQDAIVTVVMFVGVPTVIYFRNVATQAIAWFWKKPQ